MKLFIETNPEIGPVVSIEIEDSDPQDLTDADIQYSIEESAKEGSKSANTALKLMGGRVWLDMKYPRNGKFRVYCDGAW